MLTSVFVSACRLDLLCVSGVVVAWVAGWVFTGCLVCGVAVDWHGFSSDCVLVVLWFVV